MTYDVAAVRAHFPALEEGAAHFDGPGGTQAPRVVGEAMARTLAAESPDRDEALHRIRKGAKRLRYTAAATGKSAVSDAAKTIQTLLGDHQDAVISRTHVAQQAATAHAAGEDTFTYGVLYQLEDELAQSSRQQLSGALEALAKAVRKTR